jgi:hypothetical protein
MDQVCTWNTNLANHFIYESNVAKYLSALIVIPYENYGYE